MDKKVVVSRDPNIIEKVVMRIHLVILLLREKSIPWYYKAIPIGALVYVIVPVDLIPAAAFPIIGSLDDVGVVALAYSLLTQLMRVNYPQVLRKAMQACGMIPPDPAPTTT